ncbi:MAG TPA: hypothetical protein DD640_02855 [Clostridiales bacterium]|nr:hypothetical protein [Clostridiales bacterium]
MSLFTKDQLLNLQKIRLFPSISLYLPVQKEGADTRQGPIRLRRLVKATEEALRSKGLRTPHIEQLLKPIQDLYDDALFWEHQEATLALFINDDGLIMHQLPIAADESVTISDRFMIRPLLPMILHDGHYFLLALGLGDTRLYRCTRYNFGEIPLGDRPESLKDVFDTYSVERQLQHHGGSGRGRNASGGAGGSVFHSSESAKDSEKDRIDEYFRQIDASLKKTIGEDNSPLVVVCVDYLFPLFKAITRDSRVMENHISGSPDTLKREVLLRNAWEIVQPVFNKEKTAALRNCSKLMGTPRVIEDIRLVLPAAVHRQVDTLFLLEGAQAWGKIDPASGRVSLTDEGRQPDFGEEELMDQAAMQVMQHGGQAFVLTADEMPDQADCLALLRFEAPPVV